VIEASLSVRRYGCAKQVIGIDNVPERLAMAQAGGATTINSEPCGSRAQKECHSTGRVRPAAEKTYKANFGSVERHKAPSA
jgi:threonine dehydrogenase-like Zn-dependent dehydrogenase